MDIEYMGPWIWIYEYRYKDTKVHGYIQGYGDVWIQGQDRDAWIQGYSDAWLHG